MPQTLKISSSRRRCIRFQLIGIGELKASANSGCAQAGIVPAMANLAMLPGVPMETIGETKEKAQGETS
jgi:hypothetical protein